MKTKMVRLDHTGDTCVEFDPASTEAEDKANAKIAESMYHEHVTKRLPAFQTKRPSGKEDEKITSFSDIEAGAEVLLVPAIVPG